MHKAAFAAFAFLALAAGSPALAKQPPALDNIFAFDDPAHCVPAAGFRRIIDGLAVPETDGSWHGGKLILPPGYESLIAYYDTQGRFPMTTEAWGNAGHDIFALMRGDWHGLTVSSLRVLDDRSRPGLWIELRFDAGQDRIDAVLSGLGFPREPLADPLTLTCRLK
jgi:hypothetical protein